MKIVVTGGAGFVGSALVRSLLAETDHAVVNLDKLTYAADPAGLADLAGHPRYAFEQADVCDGVAVAETLARHRPDAIVHLAAETHVDRSIDAPAEFVRTNILGTQILLDAALAYWRSPAGRQRAAFRLLHVSTDEVYGSLNIDGAFTEDSPHRPNSPYAASKAASDHLARAWHRTYGLPVIISHSGNNYGPRQFPEKLVPLVTIAAIEGRPLPVYGDGGNVRDWVHVDDHARALLLMLEKGSIGETYDVSAGDERRNVDVVRAICAALDELLPNSPYRPHDRLLRFVADRPGHDWRYALSGDKLRDRLEWRPRTEFEPGLRETVAWYVDNRKWWQRIRATRYAGERLGQPAARG